MDVSERIGSGELVRMRIDTGGSPDPNTDLDDEALLAATTAASHQGDPCRTPISTGRWD